MSDASVHERLDQLRFYQTPGHECNYLSDRNASTIFVDPSTILNVDIYSQLALIGFRRSGRYLYRPRCGACAACIPIRLPVDKFSPSRTQRRIRKKNSDLHVQIRDKAFKEEHYELYVRYLKSRHPDGGMDDATPAKYQSFLYCDWMDTQFIEFRLGNKLLAVAVTDIMNNGLSALYTYFDPEYSSRSLGTHAILWQLEYARQCRMHWLYLGYWIEESPKMSYKTQYRPYEILVDGHWRKFESDARPAE